MSYQLTDDQYAELDAIPLATPAWLLTNFHELLGGPAVRGENRMMPYATVARPLRKRPAETRRTLALVIFGDADPAGTPHNDPQQGVWDNYFTLRDRFDALLLEEGDSTTTLTAHVRGRSLTGDVQVVAYQVGQALNRENLSVAVELVILGGMLREEIGSV